MKPSSSPSTLLSSASKSPSVSFFDFETRFHSMFNCGYSGAASDVIDADASSSLPTTNTSRTTILYHQASYDADESDLEEEDNTESARDYFERISKLAAAKKNEVRQEEEPTQTTTVTSTTTTPKKSSTDIVVSSSTTTTTDNKNKNKKHYEIFQFVKPTSKYGSYLKLKRTDSDSTQSTQGMSSDDDDHDDHDDNHGNNPDLSFTSDSECRDACEPLELVSILRRRTRNKEKQLTAPSNNNDHVSFSKCTVFPDPNEDPTTQKRRKRVRRIKKRKTAVMTTEGRIISTSRSRSSRSRTSIRPHLSPILVPTSTSSSGPDAFVVMQYDGNSNSNNNSNMSHKDSELRRLERRAQQQQYQQRKHRHANSDILLTEGFYVFR